MQLPFVGVDSSSYGFDCALVDDGTMLPPVVMVSLAPWSLLARCSRMSTRGAPGCPPLVYSDRASQTEIEKVLRFTFTEVLECNHFLVFELQSSLMTFVLT